MKHLTKLHPIEKEGIDYDAIERYLYRDILRNPDSSKAFHRHGLSEYERGAFSFIKENRWELRKLGFKVKVRNSSYVVLSWKGKEMLYRDSYAPNTLETLVVIQKEED